MITRVFGKKIENFYEVFHNWKQVEDDNGEIRTVYTDKPTINKARKVKEWSELCSYEGEPRYNSCNGWALHNNINISENETVAIEKEIFRADLNEMHLHTNKVVEEKDINKEDALSILEAQIKAFNKMMIESNNKLMSYCDLHKLSYEDTDCIELFKLVFPDDEYVIKDGVMKVKEKPQVSNSYDHYIGNDGCITTNATTATLICNNVSSAISTTISSSCR